MIRKHSKNTAPGEGFWFTQKRYGFGAVPTTVQGWLAISVYSILIGFVMMFLPTIAGKAVVGLWVTSAFLILVWKKTEGGWRWRWGASDED